MTSPEERLKRQRRMKRNEAARSLRNFKPKRIENKKRREKYEPVDEDYDGDYIFYNGKWHHV